MSASLEKPMAADQVAGVRFRRTSHDFGSRGRFNLSQNRKPTRPLKILMLLTADSARKRC